NPVGKEFWLCFQKNFKNDQSNNNEIFLELFITGEFDSKVKIEIDGINFLKEVNVPAETVVNVKIDQKAQVVSSEKIERLGVHVTSDQPVSVYGLNRRFQTTDTYLGLPTEVLGTEYRVMGYSVSNVDLLSQFTIVATEDSTVMTIVPTWNTTLHEKDIPYTVRLNRGDVYQVVSRYENIGKLDLTGSQIKSNKKIAVFSGHQCAYVPQSIIACNHLTEQVPPVNSWGKHFYIGILKSRSKYSYRILANENKTRVFEDSKLVKTLNSGQFYENISSKNIQITADKPVLVAQFSQGFQNGDSIGDPMMLFISPTQQFLQRYRFATPVNGFWKHYINIVVPAKAIGTLKLDGKTIDSAYFEPLGISRYSIGFINVPFGSHYIEGALPFGMYSYGFGYKGDAYDAYGTMGGQSFHDYEPVQDTVPPIAEFKYEARGNSLIFRDDRLDDSGLKEVKILESDNLEMSIPKFDEGVLQLAVDLKQIQSKTAGRAVIEATDIALNKSLFTLCFNPMGKNRRPYFSLSEGVNENCALGKGLYVGLFAKVSSVFHTADFSNTGNLSSFGKFSDASGFGGWGGIYVGREIAKKLTLSGRLSFESFGGKLVAPGQIDSIRDEITQRLLPFQEEKILGVDGVMLNFAPAAEWYFDKNFYGIIGLNLTLALSKAVTVMDRIAIPNDRIYSNGSNERISPDGPTSLSSLNTFRIGGFLGLGVNYFLDEEYAVFGEINYSAPFSNMISDGNWSVSNLSLILGIKMKLQLEMFR
ncbi:MAG: IgGFc-binding protein, partial [Bacteroidota bacterium]